MGEGEADVVAQEGCILVGKRRILEEAGEAGHVFVGEDLGGFRGEEASGGQDVDLLLALEAEDGADAVEDLPADAALARFEAAEGAVVDIGEAGDLFLGQVAVSAQVDEQGAKQRAGS